MCTMEQETVTGRKCMGETKKHGGKACHKQRESKRQREEGERECAYEKVRPKKGESMHKRGEKCKQKEQGKGAREGKGTLKKIKYAREGMYGIKEMFIRDRMECEHGRGKAGAQVRGKACNTAQGREQ